MKIKNITIGARCALAGALMLAAAAANAAPCSGVHVGTASTDDVTLAGTASDDCVIASGNAQQGPNGNPSLFDTDPDFGTGWSLLGKVDENGLFETANPASLAGVTFTMAFLRSDGDTGTWSISADQAVTLDLVFAMHAGGYTGSFLFNDHALGAGTWEIDWTNNGGQTPGYSNLTLFTRDITPAIPEPQTYALMLAGMLVIGSIVKRRRSAR